MDTYRHSPEAQLAAVLGLCVSELATLAPYLWRDVPIGVEDLLPGETWGDLGIWFAADDPVVALVGVLGESVAVLPANPRETNPKLIDYIAGFPNGAIGFRRDDPDFLRRFPAALRMVAKQVRKNNCQGLAK
jgi:hypothetical protein